MNADIVGVQSSRRTASSAGSSVLTLSMSRLSTRLALTMLLLLLHNQLEEQAASSASAKERPKQQAQRQLLTC